MTNMLAKFGAIKNSYADEDLKNLTSLAETITGRFLYRNADKGVIQKVFSGTGIFERFDEKFENLSTDVLNRMLSRGLLEKVYAGTTFEQTKGKLEFTEDHYPTPRTAEIIKNPNVFGSNELKEKFAVLYSTVISPAAQALTVGLYDDFVQTHRIGYGDSPIIQVASNEIFVVEEISEGNYRAATQVLHDNIYTANPRNRGAAVSLSFYQIASGAMRWEDHIIAIAKAFAKYYNQLAINGMKAYVEKRITANDTAYFKTSWNDTNHRALIKLLSAANDNDIINVYGDIDAISVIKPDANELGAANIMGAIGEQYLVRGYLGQYKGANIYKLRNTIVPRTINGTPVFSAPVNMLWYLNDGYKPLHAIFEGDLLTVNTNNIESADGTLRFYVQSKMDMIYVPGSKIGAIKLQ